MGSVHDFPSIGAIFATGAAMGYAARYFQVGSGAVSAADHLAVVEVRNELARRMLVMGAELQQRQPAILEMRALQQR